MKFKLPLKFLVGVFSLGILCVLIALGGTIWQALQDRPAAQVSIPEQSLGTPSIQ